MRCPKCAMELEDDDLFCGYCGAAVRESVPLADPEIDSEREKASKGKAHKHKIRAQKRNTGVKIWVLFILLAAIFGSVLGFVAGKDIVDWHSWFPSEKLIWNSFADGITETVPDASEDENDGKEQASDEASDSTQSTSPAN